MTSTRSTIAIVTSAVLFVSSCGRDDDNTSTEVPANRVSSEESQQAPGTADVNIATGASGGELGAAGDVEAFTHLLHMYSSGDPTYPTSLANVFELFDLVVVGKITGLADGRQEFLGVDAETGEPIVARYVNIEVEPDEFIQGEMHSSDQPLSIEVPWPTNVGIDGLVETVPIGNRVLVLASYQDMDYVEATSRPLIDAGLVDKDMVAENLVAVPDFGLIIEDGRSALTLGEGDIFAFASEAFGIKIDGFDHAIELLRNSAPQR